MEKLKEKKLLLIVIAVGIIITLTIVGICIYQNGKNEEDIEEETSTNPYVLDAKKADDIKINDSDSKEVKIEKIQGKIEILNREIEKKQEKVDIELERVNKLYEEYVIVKNRE